MMNNARLAVGLQGVAIAERATQQALAYARERRQGRAPGAAELKPDHRAPGRQAHAADHARAHQGGARDLLQDRGRDRCLASRPRRRRPQSGERAGLAAHAGRESILDRHRHRSSLARGAGARRHGLRRGDRRRPALPRCPHCADLRGHQRHPGDRSRHPQAAALGRRGGQRVPRRVARDGGLGRGQQPSRRSAPPARGWRRRSRASTAPPPGCSARWTPGRKQPSPEPCRICGCSVMRPAAARSPRRRWRRSAKRAMAHPTRRPGSRSPGSSPRISPCRLRGSSAPWSTARPASTRRSGAGVSLAGHGVAFAGQQDRARRSTARC